MRYFTRKVLKNEHLTTEEMKHAAMLVLAPETSDIAVTAFLTALRSKGETAEELAGMATVIRDQSTYSTLMLPEVMDNCGTGGDHSNSFNISTTAAFILAASGVNVAKHGNRNISSKTGSADVLEYLGIPLQAEPEEVSQSIEDHSIAFLFAPHVHPSLGKLRNVRTHIGLPTIFNTIGPLTNPADLHAQMIGVYAKEQMRPLAEALIQLGRKRALIVHGAGGMDEASLAGSNECLLIDHGTITSFSIHPSDVHLPVAPIDAIKGGDAAKNAHILLSVLQGEESPYADTAMLNAALGLFAYGIVEDVQEGLERARQSVASQKALHILQQMTQNNTIVKEGI